MSDGDKGHIVQFRLKKEMISIRQLHLIMVVLFAFYHIELSKSHIFKKSRICNENTYERFDSLFRKKDNIVEISHKSAIYKSPREFLRKNFLWLHKNDYNNSLKRHINVRYNKFLQEKHHSCISQDTEQLILKSDYNLNPLCKTNLNDSTTLYLCEKDLGTNTILIEGIFCNGKKPIGRLILAKVLYYGHNKSFSYSIVTNSSIIRHTYHKFKDVPSSFIDSCTHSVESFALNMSTNPCKGSKILLKQEMVGIHTDSLLFNRIPFLE